MSTLAETLLSGGSAEDIANAPLPAEYLAAYLRAEDADMFAKAQDMRDKDVRKSIRVGYVPMPQLAPDEVLVAVMASSVNYNTVWSATFEPVPTFRFLKQFARQGGWASRHDLPYQVIGSDAAGVIVRLGAGVRKWRIGEPVVISPVHVDDQEPASHADGMMGAEQRVWGFETNFGGLAEYAVVRASQLIHKPAHMTWAEAACNPLCAGTAYRMLVSENGARIKQGDIVLIWGAAGGLGGYASQFVTNGGGIAVGVVSTEAKAQVARRLGCEVVITREQIGLDKATELTAWNEVGKRLGALIRERVGRDPDVVFEHVGRATFAASVFAVRRGGTVVTCGSSSGYEHVFDNRYLWMRLKRVIGSHAANLHEMWECGRLIDSGRIATTMSDVYALADIGDAVRLVQRNEHTGKIAVLCMAPQENSGVTDPGLRERLGEDRIRPLYGRGRGTGSKLAEALETVADAHFLRRA